MNLDRSSCNGFFFFWSSHACGKSLTLHINMVGKIFNLTINIQIRSLLSHLSQSFSYSELRIPFF